MFCMFLMWMNGSVRQRNCVSVRVCIYLLGTELMCTGHEVCAEQREADGVSALGGKLQTLLEHLFKRTAVEAREGGPLNKGGTHSF